MCSHVLRGQARSSLPGVADPVTVARVRAIVIGAGIGGLSAANAVRRAGIDVAVFERMPELKEVGSGLTLWVNAMRGLAKFDAEAPIRARGAEVHSIENRRADGHAYKTLPIAKIAEKYGTHSVSIHRGELQSGLAELLPDGVVHVNSQCTGFEQDATGVTVRFADGREERADVLIGADGIGSIVRTQLFGKPEPRYSGYTCWRSAVHIDHPRLEPTVYTQLYGRGSNFGIFPIGDGYWSWYGTRMTEAGGGAGGTGAVWKQQALEQFRDWYETVPAVIEATDEQAFVRQDISDLKPIQEWGKGRVALLGDAAHATTPALGQGGCMAIEDSVVLARELSSNGDVGAALRRYVEARRDRANGIVRTARRQGYLYHGPNMLVGAVRTMVLGAAPIAIAMRVVDGLMGYEA
jgi:2-polyprenyl-6-methoxyphenol hydroxylase-like FAD-dependent oxidoreductase